MNEEPMTYEELVTENDALARRNNDLEHRLTDDVVARARKERHIAEVARQAERRQIQARFDLYWRMVLNDARRPLDGLIHRAENLPGRPRKEQVAALQGAAQDARMALARAVEDSADRSDRGASGA